MMKHVRRGLIVCLCLSFLLSLHVQAQEPLPELMLDDPMAVETELEQADAFWNGYDIGWSDGYAAGYSVWEAGEEPEVAYIDDWSLDTYEGGYSCGYVDGFWSGYDDASWEQDWKATLAEEKEEAGGSAEGYNIMVDGKCLTFTALQPQLYDGRVYVPFREFFEGLGGAVSFDEATSTATAIFQDRTFQNQLGSASLFVEEAGQRREVTMDCGSAVEQGVMLLPVRFLAEALGWYVEWDATYETAVLIDADAFQKEVDSQMTLLNTLFQEQWEATDGKTYKQDGDLLVSWQAFDSIHGDKTYTARGKLDTLFNEQAQNISLSLDLREFIPLMADTFYLEDDDEALSVLKNIIQAEGIYSLEENIFYATVSGLEQNIWVQLSLDGFYDAIGWDYTMPVTVGSLLWNYAQSQYYVDPFYLYDTMKSGLQTLVQLFGDDGFTKQADRYTRTWTTDSLLKMLQDTMTPEEWDWMEDYYAQELGDLQAQLTIMKNSDGSSNYTMNMDWTLKELQFSLSAEQRKTYAQASVQFHIKNVGICQVEVEANLKESKEPVETQPPEGAIVVPLDSLYG